MRGEIDHFFHLAAIYDIDRRRRGPGGRQRRGHPPRDRACRRDRGGLLPPGQLDRRRRPLPGRLARGHVRRGRKARHQPLLPHQARGRAGGPRGVPRGRGGSTGRGSSSATRAPARSTRSTAPTTSSSSLQRARRVLPSWLPTVGVEGGEINIVPVDYVADAIDHIAHEPGLDGQAFHLTDPAPAEGRRGRQHLRQGGRRAADGAAARPRRHRAGDRRCCAPALRLFPPAKRASRAVLGELGLPAAVLTYVNYPTRFDSTNAQAGAGGLGIDVPPLESYADADLGLLGAQPRPRPVQGPHRSRARCAARSC